MASVKIELKNWRRLLADEWRWYRAHGGGMDIAKSVAAYVARYGRASDPEPKRYGEGGEPIHEADRAALTRKIREVARLAGRGIFGRRGPNRYLPEMWEVAGGLGALANADD